MDLNPIRSAATALLEALDAAEAQPPAPLAIPWRPSAAEDEAFAAEHGLTLEQVRGWDGVGPNDAQQKIAPLDNYPAATFGSAGAFTIVAPSKEKAIAYAARGYRMDGSRWNWRRADLEAARATCDRVHAGTAEEVETIVSGASRYMAEDAVELAVMTGVLPGNPIPKHAADETGIIGPVAGELATTIEDVVLYLSAPAAQPWA